MVKVIKIKHAASATTVHETGGTAWLALRLNDRRGKRSGPVKEFVKRYGESFHRPAAGLPAAGAVTWGPGVLRGRVAASHRPGARRPLGPWRRRSPRSPRPRPRPRPLPHSPAVTPHPHGAPAPRAWPLGASRRLVPVPDHSPAALLGPAGSRLPTADSRPAAARPPARARTRRHAGLTRRAQPMASAALPRVRSPAPHPSRAPHGGPAPRPGGVRPGPWRPRPSAPGQWRARTVAQLPPGGGAGQDHVGRIHPLPLPGSPARRPRASAASEGQSLGNTGKTVRRCLIIKRSAERQGSKPSLCSIPNTEKGFLEFNILSKK